MNAFRYAVLFAVCFEIMGCASQESRLQAAIAPVAPPPADAGINLDELVRFGAEFARLSTSARFAECRRLQQQRRTDPGLGVRLRLLLARTIANCGEVGESIAILESALARIDDERLRSFLAYHKAILTRLARETERRKALDRQIVQTRASETKTTRRLRSQERELKTLQEKLEALKAIEQDLGKPNDGQ
jgi:hypothetical protein